MPLPDAPGFPEALRVGAGNDEPESVVGPHPDLAGQLLNGVVGSRWFGGKGRRAELTGHVRLPWLTAVDRWPGVRIEIVEISYPDDEPEGGDGPAGHAGHELYQLVVSYWPAPRSELHHAELARVTDPDLGLAVAYDAAQDPAACRVLLEHLLAGRTVRGAGAELRFHLSSAQGLTADLIPRPFKGQQSNTSVMFGDVAMMKLFRRLEIGRNLDIEVHDALNRAGLADVARLFGWIEASWPHRGADRNADLAMVVEKLAAAEDGWDLALAALSAGESFAEQAARLGSDLAEIHHALRDAFPTDRHSGATAAALMTERFHAARRVAPALDAHTEQVLSCFRALAHLDLDLQRVHGDFHLGQTLHTPDGWKIIDFEGEPAKTLAERARPDSVWRDVAGMLRSFDYAGAHAPGPHSAGWVADCRAAFTAAYAGGGPAPDDAVILRAYEMDKAVYEVVYEVRNRPDWVHIPMAALAALAAPADRETAPDREAAPDQETAPDQTSSTTTDPGPDEA